MTKDGRTEPKNREENSVDLDRVRAVLVRLWLIGSALPFVVLLCQSVSGTYYNALTKSSQLQDAWSWFVPTVFPTLSLMIGVMGAGASGQQHKRHVQGSFAALTKWLSVAYLAILTVTILAEPFAPDAYQGVQFLKVANFWIGPTQALTIAALGFLFGSSRAK